eukprot:UN06019
MKQYPSSQSLTLIKSNTFEKRNRRMSTDQNIRVNIEQLLIENHMLLYLIDHYTNELNCIKSLNDEGIMTVARNTVCHVTAMKISLVSERKILSHLKQVQVYHSPLDIILNFNRRQLHINLRLFQEERGLYVKYKNETYLNR